MTETNPEKGAGAGCVDAQAFHSCQDRLLSPQLTQAPLQPSYQHIKSYPALFLDCCCSVAKSRPALCDLLDHSTPGLPILQYWSLFRLMSIESEIPSNHLVLCRPLLLLPSIFSSIRVFSNGSILCIRWPEYAQHKTDHLKHL